MAKATLVSHAGALILVACVCSNLARCHPEVLFYANRPLADEQSRRQGLSALHPSGDRVRSIDITLTAARIKGCANREDLMVDLVAPVYRNDASGEYGLHGPTLRVRQGDVLRISLRNNLTRPVPPPGAPPAPLNAFSHAADTNLHAHGMHAWPGVAAQEQAGTYTTNDNIFYSVLGKASDAVPAEQLNAEPYTINVCREHMPGMAWYHPHHHGSTSVQVPTANGLIVVEGGPEWMPDHSGCTEIRELIAAAPERILHFQLLPFRPPATADPSGAGDPQWALDMDDPNLQLASRLSDPPNPLCCGGEAGGEPLRGSATDRDIVLLNSGYQPIIHMRAGKYQRWRMAWAASKRFASITILDKAAKGGPRPAPCDLLLISKDGVYLMQIPRKVGHVFLSPGNRAELLVRCEGKPGARYTLQAQDPSSSPFGCSLSGSRNALIQELATIQIKKPDGPAQRRPTLRACTPARAGYVADLRDASLEAAGATSKLLRQQVSFTFPPGSKFGCLVNDKNFSFPDPDPIVLPLGSVVEWAPDHIHAHPFHMHTNPFQLQELSPDNLVPGCSYSNWFEPGDYHDTLMLPMIQKMARAPLRLQPGEYTGYTVLHCHSLHHEDTGCMAVVKFACPGHDDPQPRACPGFEFPVPATVRLAGQGEAEGQPVPSSAGAGAGAAGPTEDSWLSWARRVAARLGMLLPF